MIRYGSHYIDKLDLKSVQSALESSMITQGSYVEKFEKKLSFYFGSSYAIALSNGTAALDLAIKSLNLRKNSKILTSPITFISTASTILMNNLSPDFADIDEKSYTLDPNFVEDRIKKNKNIRAVIGVDFAGHPCDWDAFYYLKNKYGVYLINDNCHALGSKLSNKKDYAVKYADIVTQSYHAVKNFTTGEGGSVLTNQKKIANFVRSQRSHGMIKNNLTKKKGLWYYNVPDYGHNYRLTDFQCALGISQLKKLDKFVKKRRVVAKKYDSFFKKYPDLFKIPEVKSKNIYHSYHLYPLQFNFKNINKKSFFLKLMKKKITLQVHYVPLYKQPFLKKFIKNSNYPNSESFYKNMFSLPIFFELNDKQQNYIIKEILDLMRNK